MKGSVLPLLFSNASHPGKVRTVNEDDFGYFPLGARHVFVVADGMGGEAGGREASTTAVREVRRVFESSPADPIPDVMRAAAAAANEACLARQKEDPELATMGTTLVILVVEEDRAFWAHVGDSRLYRVTGGKAEQLTVDHTLVQRMLEGGLLTPEEAAEHPKRHVLSRVIGRPGEYTPDVTTEPYQMKEGDAFVLCSDGLSDVVSAEEIALLVSKCGPQRGCDRLIRLALDRGAPDNVTVQIVYKGRPKVSWMRVRTVVQLAGEGNPGKKRRITLAAGGIAVLILLFGTAIAYYSWKREPSNLVTPRAEAVLERGKSKKQQDPAATPSPSPSPGSARHSRGNRE